MSELLNYSLEEAKFTALKHIGINVYSSGKIIQYLISKGFAPSVTESAVCELVERGYIDDIRACKKIVYGRTGKKIESIALTRKRLIDGGIPSRTAELFLKDSPNDSERIIELYDSIASSGAVSFVDYDDCYKYLIPYAKKRGFAFELSSSAVGRWYNDSSK